VERSPTLQEYLEKYLKREGLYNVISEYRRSSLFTLPIAFIWLAGLWILAIYFLLRYRGFGGLMMAIFGPVVLLAGTLLMLVIFFAVRQFRLGKKLAYTEAGMIGTVLILGFPVLMAIVLGFYLSSLSVTVWYIVLSVAGMMFVLFLQRQTYKIHLLIELVRLTLKVLWRSVTLLPVLAPLLLVVVLLSVFSQELWEFLGSLSLARFIVSVFLIAFPAFLYVLASFKQEAMQIVGELPEEERIVENAQNTIFIKNKLDSGLISEEEWARLRSELEWRDKSRLAENLMPILQNRVRLWLALLLGLTNIALITSFFVYFCILLGVLVKHSLIAAWVDMQLGTLKVPLSCFGYSLEVSLPTTVVPIVKVSLLLAIFVAVMFSVYAFTEDSFKRAFTERLKQKAASWLAVSSVYQGITSPNYQIWEYVVRDKQKGIANVSIVVPQGLHKEVVEKACEHMESRLQEYRNLVLVTAFEQNIKKPIYRRGMPGNRWRLLHNKTKDIRIFETISLILDELRYQHFLGMDSLQEEEKIPDGWFGNTPQGRILAKAVWETDVDHEWVLHPYTFECDNFLSLEVHLMKKMARSDQYRQYIRELLTIARKSTSPPLTIDIDLYFRDTVDSLAMVFWSTDLPYVEYRDETGAETSTDSRQKWED